MRSSDWSSDVCSSDLRDAIGHVDAVHPLETCHHVEHRIALAGAEVPDAERRLARGDGVEGRDMAFGKIDDMDIVAHPGAVGGVVIVAEYRQLDRKSTRLNSSH